MKIRKLKPKCLEENRDLAYTTTGHLTPCCWVNTEFNEHYLRQILSPKMQINNFNSVEEILTSRPWINFFKMLKENPQAAPRVCKRYCGFNKSWAEIEGEEIFINPDD